MAILVLLVAYLAQAFDLCCASGLCCCCEDGCSDHNVTYQLIELAAVPRPAPVALPRPAMVASALPSEEARAPVTPLVARRAPQRGPPASSVLN